ncbi:MAG: hypothetical protein ABIK09_12510 [Pseudomonadota bacterium]
MDPNDQQTILAALGGLAVEDLERLVEYHDYQYWVLDKPAIDDEAYDLLVRRLMDLAPASEVLERVGGNRGAPTLGDKVEHAQPMLSLDKCYTAAEFGQWLELLRGVLPGAGPPVSGWEMMLTPKIDGVAASLRYGDDGRLALAATRGNGRVGEDFTVNARLIPDIPWQVDLPGLEVRGEVYMRRSVFEAKYADQFANPRNLTAGTLKQKESSRNQILDLAFFAYDARGLDVASEAEKYERLAALGFAPPEPRQVVTASAVAAAFEALLADRAAWDFDVDGVVVKVMDVALHEVLGATAHHPRNAIAFKFQGDTGFSVLREVHWNVSRTGRITPVSIVDPVLLSGANVSRCSLHNISIFRAHGLRIGDRVQVTRWGGVIPNLEASLGGGDAIVEIPRRCPSCDRETLLVAPQLFVGGVRLSRWGTAEDARIIADDRLAVWKPELLADVLGSTNRVARRSPTSDKGEVFHGGDRQYKEALTWKIRGDLDGEHRVRDALRPLPSVAPPGARLGAVFVHDPSSPASCRALAAAAELLRERPLRLWVLPIPDGHLRGDAPSPEWDRLLEASRSGATWDALREAARLPAFPKTWEVREGRVHEAPREGLLALAADLSDDMLVCSDPGACKDAVIGQLLHFTRGLGVEGFGPKHMETLYDQGLLQGLPDLFRLRVEELMPLDRMGELLATKLVEELRGARTQPLSRFLAALGVDELAAAVSELLEREVGELPRVLALTEAELGAYPQVNFTIAHQALSGLRRLRPVIDALLEFITLAAPTAAAETVGAFAGKSFVFTGKMATMERKAALVRVKALGGEAPSQVVKDLDYLVVGDDGSPLFGQGRKGSKLLKAETYNEAGGGIRIIAEREFVEMVQAAEGLLK